MALQSQGCYLYFSTSTALSTAIAIGGVTGFNGPTGQANTIDETTLNSTRKEFLMGLPDEGELSLDVVYLTTDTGQIKLRECRAARTKSHFALKMTDTAITQVDADCYVLGLTIQGGIDNAIKGTVNFKITGPLNYTTVAA